MDVRDLAVVVRLLVAAALLACATPSLAGALPPPLPPASSTSPTPSASPASHSPAAAAASPSPATSAAQPSPTPDADVPPLYVRGQVLTIAAGFCIFTTGDSVRVAPGLVVPHGVTTGSYVRVTIDQLARAVVAIELEPKTDLAGEVDATNIPRQYVVVSPKSAPLPAPSGQTNAATGGPVTVTIVVHVPGNTPSSDNVFLSTDRSSYSPYELPMQRVDGTTFKVTVTVPAGSVLRYLFARGTQGTVERDRSGGIVAPRALNGEPSTTTDDTVARWADLS